MGGGGGGFNPVAAVSNAVSSVASNVSNAASNVVSGVEHGDIKKAGLGVVSGSVAMGPGLSTSAFGPGQTGSWIPGIGSNVASYQNSIAGISSGNVTRANLLSLAGASSSIASSIGGGSLLNGVGTDLGIDPSLVGAFKSGMSGGPGSVNAARDPAGGVAIAPAPAQSLNSKLLMGAIVGGLVLILVLKRRRK